MADGLFDGPKLRMCSPLANLLHSDAEIPLGRLCGQAGGLVFVAQTCYIKLVRSASLPAVRITPELKQQLEGVLADGETVSALVERAVRGEIERRIMEDEFRQLGIQAIERVEAGGAYLTAEEVRGKLEAKLQRAKASRAGR